MPSMVSSRPSVRVRSTGVTGISDDPALLLAQPGGLLDEILPGEWQTDRHLVHDLAVQDGFQIIDRAEQGPPQMDSVVCLVGHQVSDDHQPEFMVGFDEVGEGLGPRIGAQNEHEARVSPMVAQEHEEHPHCDPDGQRGHGQEREDEQQEQAADVRQLQQEQGAQGDHPQRGRRLEDLGGFAPDRPPSAAPVEPTEPQQSNPGHHEGSHGQPGFRQGRVQRYGPVTDRTEPQQSGSVNDDHGQHRVGSHERQPKHVGVASNYPTLSRKAPTGLPSSVKRPQVSLASSRFMQLPGAAVALAGSACGPGVASDPGPGPCAGA